METNDLKDIWLAYDAKLEKSLKLNKQLMENLQEQKIRSAFTQLLVLKIAEIAFSIFLLSLLGSFIMSNLAKFYFVVAAGILMIFCITMIVMSARQIYFIANIRYDQNILEYQKKSGLFQTTAMLKTSIVAYLRMGILSIPFYTAYIIIGFKAIFNIDIVAQGDSLWWIIQIIISIFLIPVSIWLYNKISYKNIHIKWVRTLIENTGGKSTEKAMDFLTELEEFEKEAL